MLIEIIEYIAHGVPFWRAAEDAGLNEFARLFSTIMPQPNPRSTK